MEEWRKAFFYNQKEKGRWKGNRGTYRDNYGGGNHKATGNITLEDVDGATTEDRRARHSGGGRAAWTRIIHLSLVKEGCRRKKGKERNRQKKNSRGDEIAETMTFP